MARSASAMAMLRACLGHPFTGRMSGYAPKPHAATLDLHEEQDVQPNKSDCLDREEVACEHPSGLGAKKLGPGRAATPRGPAPSHVVGGCSAPRCPTPSSRAWRTRCRPAGIPTGVLPRQPQDQLHNGRVEAPLDTGLTSVGPSTSHQVPMPAQQRRPA
jgi:hypothetical protein